MSGTCLGWIAAVVVLAILAVGAPVAVASLAGNESGTTSITVVEVCAGTDPITQNRYAFAGGNPVNNIEFNGHEPEGSFTNGCDSIYGSSDRCRGQQREQAQSSHASAQQGAAQEGVVLAAPRFLQTQASEQAATKAVGNALAQGVAKSAPVITPPRPLLRQTFNTSGRDLLGGASWEISAGVLCFGDRSSPLFAAAGIAASANPKGLVQAGVKRGAKGLLDDAGDATKGGARGRPCPANSFAAGTRVLMGDGSSKAIEQVRVGDMVVATNLDTGLTGRFAVTTLITGTGSKDMVALTIASKTLVATARHSFWVANKRAWIDARDVRAGDMLQRPNGTLVAVEQARPFTVLGGRVHNLTVAGAHTFYAGALPVLVHNQGCGGGAADDVILGARGLRS